MPFTHLFETEFFGKAVLVSYKKYLLNTDIYTKDFLKNFHGVVPCSILLPVLLTFIPNGSWDAVSMLLFHPLS